MENFKKSLKKGVLELSILKLLNDKDHYGYSLMSEIENLSHEAIQIKDGTLYPILYRLEDQKMIENYWETNIEGRNKPRKYYRITEKGKSNLEEKLKDYKEITNGVKNILGL